MRIAVIGSGVSRLGPPICSRGEPDDYVLSTSTGSKHNPSNLRRDVLQPAVEAANEDLAKDGIAAIAPVTFHSLRRTYASLRCAAKEDVAYTAPRLGHTDARFTLKTYTQATKRRERLSGPHLRAYDRALEWAQMGTTGVETVAAVSMKATKTPSSGAFLKGEFQRVGGVPNSSPMPLVKRSSMYDAPPSHATTPAAPG